MEMLTDKEALEKARRKLSIAVHYSECGANDGIRAIYADEAEWLCVLIRNAERALKDMRKGDTDGE